MPPKKAVKGKKTESVATDVQMNGTAEEVPARKRGRAKLTERNPQVNGKSTPLNELENGHSTIEKLSPPKKKRSTRHHSVEKAAQNGEDAVDHSAGTGEPQTNEVPVGRTRGGRTASQANLVSNEKSELEAKGTTLTKPKGRSCKQDTKSVDLLPMAVQTEAEAPSVASDEKSEKTLETKEMLLKNSDPGAKKITGKKGKGRPRKPDAKSDDVPEVAVAEAVLSCLDSDGKSEQTIVTKETLLKNSDGAAKETAAKKSKGRPRKQETNDSKADPVLARGLKHKTEGQSSKSSSETKELRVSLLRQKNVDDMAMEEMQREGKIKAAVGPSKPSRKRGREAAGEASKPPSEDSGSGFTKREKIKDVPALSSEDASTTGKGGAWNLKITSWNINGIRAWLEKDCLLYLRKEQPDVLCVQETKCSKEKLPQEASVDGYHCYWLSGEKDGYSGVGLLSKQKPLAVEYGIGFEEHDAEGRVITAEFEKFYLVTAYVPNAGRGLVRLEYRKQWDVDFRAYLKKLDVSKPVILCGDLNVAHKEIDLANPKTNKKNAGFTQEERDGFSALLAEGFVDAFRRLYPDTTGAYTFWTYMMNARAKNVGWRLDYFVLSERFTEHLSDCVIHSKVMGSDHCPLVLFLNI